MIVTGTSADRKSDQYVESCRRRIVHEILTEAEGIYWMRRTAQFEAARPKAGDYCGRATRADLRARDVRLAAIARACRRKAKVVMMMAGVEVIDEVFFVTNEEIFFANISSERVLDV